LGELHSEPRVPPKLEPPLERPLLEDPQRPAVSQALPQQAERPSDANRESQEPRARRLLLAQPVSP